MGNKQELIERLSPMLKEKGYKKVKQTWHKQNSDLIIVFNIQNSSYSKEDYYINLGSLSQYGLLSKRTCRICKCSREVIGRYVLLPCQVKKHSRYFFSRALGAAVFTRNLQLQSI